MPALPPSCAGICRIPGRGRVSWRRTAAAAAPRSATSNWSMATGASSTGTMAWPATCCPVPRDSGRSICRTEPRRPRKQGCGSMVSRHAIAWRRLTLSISGALIVATCASSSPPPASETPPVSNGGLVLLDGPSMHDSDQLLYLEVVLNQVPTNYILQVAQRDGTLYVLPEHLTTLGLLMGELPPGEHQALESLPDLPYRYDVPRQQLYLEAPPHRLDRELQAYRAARDATPRAEASPGILLNYDMHVSADELGGRDVTAATGLRAFAGNLVLENTAFSRTSNRGDRGDHSLLDTHWTWSSQEDLLTVTAGDLISGGLPWTRATRLGGLQIRRNFGLQPDLVTQPLPAFFGEAALPSAIELYVEGQRQYSGEVLPGDYRIDSHPAVTGLGQAEVVLTDALGRTTVHDFSFYSSPRLLQQGLSDFSLEVGSVRRGYGKIGRASCRERVWSPVGGGV